MVWVELPEGGETKHTVAPPASAPVLEFYLVIAYEFPYQSAEAGSVVGAEMPLVYPPDLRGFEPQTYDLVYEGPTGPLSPTSRVSSWRVCIAGQSNSSIAHRDPRGNRKDRIARSAAGHPPPR